MSAGYYNIDDILAEEEVWLTMLLSRALSHELLFAENPMCVQHPRGGFGVPG